MTHGWVGFTLCKDVPPCKGVGRKSVGRNRLKSRNESVDQNRPKSEISRKAETRVGWLKLVGEAKGEPKRGSVSQIRIQSKRSSIKHIHIYVCVYIYIYITREISIYIYWQLYYCMCMWDNSLEEKDWQKGGETHNEIECARKYKWVSCKIGVIQRLTERKAQ